MFRITCASLLLALIMILPCQAGEITQSLEYYLEDVTAISADSAIQVIVMFDEQADIESLDKQLKQEKATLAERNRRVIQTLQDVASKTQGTATAYFDQLKSQGYITEYKTLWIANMAIVTANRGGIYAMADNMDIGEITLSYGIESIKPVDDPQESYPVTASVESGLEVINAPAAWAAGYTGAGRVVANIDTGVDGIHPALADRFLGDVDNDGDYDESWLDPYDETNWEFPQDSHYHGTHTMGTICGRSAAGDTIGVAIDAKWIASAAISREDYNLDQTIEDAIESFQWMVDPDGNSNTQDNPDAVCNSWGLIPYIHAYPCDETFWTVIDNLEAAGTVVVFAAGNEGNPNSLRSPADRAVTEYNVFSVGAFNGHHYTYPIAEWSSKGPSYCNSDSTVAIKPEISAPGVSIRSSVPDSNYSNMSGTSMAAPHVAGAVALLRQVDPNLEVDAIKELLMATAVDLGDFGPDNSYGQGRMDVYQACHLASTGYGYIDGYVYDDDTDSYMAGALVSVDGSVKKMHTDANGYYKFLLRADSSFTITASAYGYYASTQTGITVNSGNTTSADFALEKAEYGILHGYVTDQDNNPVENVKIFAIDTPLDTIFTDSDGYYIFESIAGGTSYTVNTYRSYYNDLSDTIYVSATDTTRLDLSIKWFDSFESADGGFVSEGLWERGNPHWQSAYNGWKVWCTGVSGYVDCDMNGCDYSLFSPTYHITENDAGFSFYQWYDIENGFDGGNVQISTDNGSTWEVLTPVGGYPYSSIEVLDNQPGFSGETIIWDFVEYNLDDYADEYVKLRFRFAADETKCWYGWYIDGFVFDGATIIAPDVELSQSSLQVRVDSDENQTESITIANSGLSDLEFDTRIVTFPSTTVDSTGDEPQNDDGLITTTYGPDDFGYFLYDSDESDGPEYSWIDISDVGTAVSFNGSSSEGYSDLISMGISFEFYGEYYSNLTITTAGYIMFGACTYIHFNPSNIPSGNEPNNFIAVLWGSQDGEDGTCYYYYDSDENRFIVSWLNWRGGFEGNSHYNYQVILDADDNSITMQYDNVSLGEGLIPIVGIENATGEIGLEYSEDLYGGLPNDFAIEFYYPVFWLSADPMTGTISPGNSQTINITFDAEGLVDNWYYGNIYYTTNDPYQEVFTVTCDMGVGTVDIDDGNDAVLPSVFSLNQNYPNPFNPTTEILFNIPKRGYVTLDVYDVLGRKVTTLVDEELAAGTHNVIWSGTNSSGDKVSSGIYFYKLTQNDNSVTKKMVLIK